MKIVVDQMPDKPSDCPHSIYRDAKSSGWYGCSKRSIVCEIGEPGRECPIYIGLSGALKSMAVVHGYWIPVDEKEDAYDCSVCDAMVQKRHDFCPKCGSKMDMKG